MLVLVLVMMAAATVMVVPRAARSPMDDMECSCADALVTV